MVPPSSSFRRGRNIRSQSHSFQTSSKFVRKKKAGRNFQYKLRENAGALRCQDYLTSAFLNIDGLSDAKLADVQKFATKVKPDIFLVLETKRRQEDIGSDITVDGYDHTEIRRSDAAGDKAGGGIAYYTRSSGGILFKRHSPTIMHKDLEYVQNERFWIIVESQECKTAICGL